MSSFKSFLKEEAEAIISAADNLNDEQVELALSLIETCSDKGAKLIITGVGKSGIVSRKIAATFSSIGLMSLFLSPLDALHGDLGVVSPNDICLILSNSGETSELLELLPHLQKRGNSIIALVGKTASSLARGADVVLDASVHKEVCPLNLAPTASTAVAMAIGDALASAWMTMTKISPADFALNHPAGLLGKKLTLKASDVMVPVSRINSFSPKSLLPEIIAGLTKDGIGCGWVEDPSSQFNILGLITDGDLRRALESNTSDTWASLSAIDLMTRNPITVKKDVLLVKAIELMECNVKKPISVMPVISDNEESNMVIGFLRLHDLIQSGLT